MSRCQEVITSSYVVRDEMSSELNQHMRPGAVQETGDAMGYGSTGAILRVDLGRGTMSVETFDEAF
jgi:hypothetical protein